MKNLKDWIKNNKIATGVIIVLGLGILGNLNKDEVEGNKVEKTPVTQEQQTETTQEVESTVDSNKDDKKDKKITEWNGHDLGKNKFVLSNDEYCFVIKKIDKVKDTIRLTYTFINESGDNSSAIWNFQCKPYQNGISLNDNKDYKGHYYKCGNEQTSVRSGYSIDDCWELIPVGDGTDIECDIGAGMWNDTHIFKINVDTMKWSIEEK